MKREHYLMSNEVVKGMLEEFKSFPTHRACTDCLLAGLQITEGTGRPVLHPLHLLVRSYGLSY
jgi:hypothetical protein